MGALGREVVEPLLVGLSKAHGDLLHGREDHEVVRIEGLGEKLSREVLVDDGRGTLEVGVARGLHGNAAATAGDDHVVGSDKRGDRVQLDDALRPGRSHDTAVASA